MFLNYSFYIFILKLYILLIYMDKDIIIAIILIIILITVYYYNNKNIIINQSVNKENFKSETNSNNYDVIVFMSKNCGACIEYNRTHYDNFKKNLEDKSNGNINVKKIYDDDDKDKLFEKYDIEFIPTGVVINKKSSKSKKINGFISVENTMKTIENMDK